MQQASALRYSEEGPDEEVVGNLLLQVEGVLTDMSSYLNLSTKEKATLLYQRKVRP